ncbi:unnamed protein product [Parajaminaea phylloscopi]
MAPQAPSSSAQAGSIAPSDEPLEPAVPPTATATPTGAPSSSNSGPQQQDSRLPEAEQYDAAAAPAKKARTTYNTFLSPSGSTSFFTTSWFEKRPIKDLKDAVAASVGADAGTSASTAGSSSRAARRRPSYEEYRSQEPPQARLIRLRGLFDVLMHNDQREALADGRAKDAWTATARRARYGAGGKLARGSLAREMHMEREMDGKEKELDADRLTEAQSSADNSREYKEPPQPAPPRQSYANELLAQCRQCRIDLEKERSKRSTSTKQQSEEPSTQTGLLKHIPWPFSSSDEPANEARAPSSSSSSSSSQHLKSLWTNLTAGDQQAQRQEDAELEADYDGESGYTGSGVWGLSAVKHGSRDRERERERERERQRQEGHGETSAKSNGSSNKATATENQAESEEEGTKRMMIEWEGFIKYAETKERELFKIFSELDRNGDMRLDVAEIRLALGKAGIELAPASLEDFIASLSSSTRTSDPHAPGTSTWYSQDPPTPTYITWPEFRDYLLLLPRQPSVNEIFRFYQVRKAFGLFGIGGIFCEFGNSWGNSQRHGATAITSDGDVSMAGEEKKRKSPPLSGASVDEKKKAAREALAAERSGEDSSSETHTDSESASATARDSQSDASSSGGSQSSGADGADDGSADDDHGATEEEEDTDMIHSDVALKFLLAGGIAGAVSRTATAPFDRLKIYLITASHSGDTATAAAAQTIKTSGAEAAAKNAGQIASKGLGVLGVAVRSLYRDGGGLKAFWLGNGLNCIKIFPESAIKFLSYEMSKRAFAKYVDHVSDSRDISGTSRFISGGIGGITSQLAIYPVETLKTRLMSSQGEKAPLDAKTGQRLAGNELLLATARNMWSAGGLRVYYRGLTAGLVGVFPYSAIDMSTFEGIKLAYMSYTGKDEPETLALLAFGSLSGSVGATTVYPLNLIRTRLQAAGTPAHPQVYDGFMDAVKQTYRKEGVVGFYRGLVPTLAKVVPAVSISYVCYENSKKRLGVA